MAIQEPSGPKTWYTQTNCAGKNHFATFTREEDTRLKEHHLYHLHWQKALAPWPSSPPLQELSSQDDANLETTVIIFREWTIQTYDESDLVAYGLH